MTLLDSYAVLALLRDEPAAGEVRELLEDDGGALTALGVAEVVDHLVRLAGSAEDEAAIDVAQLGLADPVAVDGRLALRAGLLRARHYHRRERAVSLADCVLAETARALGTPAASADPHLLDMCRDEGVAVVALPGSSGNRWSP